MATEHQWKQFCEGLARGTIGPFRQVNETLGDDCFRTYWDGPFSVAEMRVYGANTDAHSIDCRRTFTIDGTLIDAVAHIIIPTDEDWAELDDLIAENPDYDDETHMRKRGWIE